ncbi:multicopper oxidase family protein [Paenibacillus sp. GCM10023252]|uniref:multicopper oxidase family protein n=1 Tax=Paenibacillus sp. GCM10023252 TaxID=3252649 RepID=UPI0036105CBA
MIETIVSVLCAITMTLLAAAASVLVTGLSERRTNRGLALSRGAALGLCWSGAAILLVWCGFVAQQWISGGWLMVEGTVIIMVPLLLVGYMPVLIYTLPRLARVSADREAGKEAVSLDISRQAADPGLVIPVYGSAAASVVHLQTVIFDQPVLPDLTDLLLKLLVLLILVLAPGYYSVRRYRALLRRPLPRPKLWKRAVRIAGVTAAAVVVSLAVMVTSLFLAAQSSKLPEASDMMNHQAMDEGGGTPTMMSSKGRYGAHANGHANHTAGQNQNQQASMVEVADLTGDLSAPATSSFELVAMKKEVTLASGAMVDSWTYNGEIAPELRVQQGEMVEVKLVNKDIDSGVTIHWHGYNVPNAMDGVPGMTQNVVLPGQSFTYKFHAKQAGTYWFHSHQQASDQVERGLFGTLTVEPEAEEAFDEDITVMNHRWSTRDGGGRTAFGYEDEVQLRKVQPGSRVRLRVINTDNSSEHYVLQGVPYQVTSIDGVSIKSPGMLEERTAIRVASGGRYEVVFVMPDHPVGFKMGAADAADKPGIVFYTGEVPADLGFEPGLHEFDPSDYGDPLESELTAEGMKFDRDFTMIMGNRMGFYNGILYFLWTVNGEVHPRTPTFVVKEGERVRTTFVNRSLAEHPMHLHGHHMTVLSKDGKRVKTPWVTDTLNVQPGERYEVAFVADNPGMWMDHCHNLHHAATGMVLHLMYDHVMPSYEVGTRSGNLPD